MSSDAAPPAKPAAAKPQPSLHARKLLQKLAALSSSASPDSLQTVAGWMVFNRKKAEGMGEGLVVAIDEAAASAGDDGGTARLMLLLRILHRALMANCPTAGAEGDVDKWEKSAPLRVTLGEAAVEPLWKALAASFAKVDGAAREKHAEEVRGMLEEWKERNVFGGPTVVDEYRRGWNRALKGAEGGGGEGATKEAPTEAEAETAKAPETTAEKGDDGEKEASPDAASDGADKVEEKAETATDAKEEKPETKEAVDATPTPSSAAAEDDASKASAPASKRDSVASLPEVEVDFEGVEEAKVEPSQFLDACKVIASIQIARDIGSDAAMNLSSALAGVPAEVEEACTKVLEQQKGAGKEGAPTDNVAELLSDPEALSKLPDEVLDIDIPHARRSLQAYRESIRKQRQARLRCLQLLLASRCDFGSMEAARAFCGDGDEDGEGKANMEEILDGLRKRKEALVDALALEGLDVEEEDDKKKGGGEEGALETPDWFPGQAEGPAAKKLKTG
ncbi:hypothetical protein ACHAXT_009816 [Thalassiosira profunda]